MCRILLGAILTGLLALPAVAQDDSWKVEVDNTLVRVARRFLAPRETVTTSAMPPALLVFLSDYSVRLTTATRQAELRHKPGELLWHAGGRMRLENFGDNRLEVVQVAAKFSPASEGLADVLSSRNLVFENDFVHVKHLHFTHGRRAADSSADPAVDHVLPAVVFHLSAARINLRQAEGRVERVRMKAGDIRFEPRGFFSGGNPPLKPSGEDEDDWVEVLRIQLKAGN